MVDEGLRVNVNENGEILLFIDDKYIALSKIQTDALIDLLKTAQNDARELLEFKKKRDIIVKNYNSAGRRITDYKNEKIF